MRILLVEDSTTVLMQNAWLLQESGHEVICAQDGEMALRMAREKVPDLILLDMMLPIMSGADVLVQLKKAPETAEIPVVVLSNLGEKNRQKLMEAGAEAYIEKSSLTPTKGTNLLPEMLKNIVSRINRKRIEAK
jgi:two-component system, OmpR family, phosphate regulon response regulator PhoB